MQEPSFLILSALLSGPLHGYALREEAERASAGRTRLQVGTLYAALDRLSGTGLIEMSAEEIVNGRARRSYRVTDAGREAVLAESLRMADLAREAQRRLRASSSSASLTVRPT